MANQYWFLKTVLVDKLLDIVGHNFVVVLFSMRGVAMVSQVLTAGEYGHPEI